MDTATLDGTSESKTWSKSQAIAILAGGLLLIVGALFGLSAATVDSECIDFDRAREMARENPPVNIVTCGGLLIQTPILE